MTAARPDRAYERWTPDEDKALLAARAEGRRHTEIGAALGRSADSVGWRARELHAATRQRPWSPDELAMALRLRRLERRWYEIRDKLTANGYPCRSISTIVRKLRPHLPLDPRVLQLWTGPELRLAQQLRADGKTFRQTAAGLQAAGYPRRSGAAVARMFFRVATARLES